MILLRKIHLKNFLSHKDTEIEIGDKTRTLLDGASGAGKSSVVDALVWALYGKGRTDNRSLIKRGTAACAVIVELSDGEKMYRIERGMTKSGKHTLALAEKIEGKYTLCKITGTKAIQEFIENKILKSSYLLFINSAVYPQDNMENFVKQTAEKRKDIIMEIIRAADYDGYHEKAKEQIKNIQIVNASNIAAKEQKEQFIKANEPVILDIKNLEVSLEKLKEQENQAKLKLEDVKEKRKINDALEKSFFEVKTSLAGTQKQLGITQKTLADKKLILFKLKEVDLKSLSEKVDKLTQVRKQLAVLDIVRSECEEWQKKKMILLASKPTRIDYDSQKNSLVARINSLASTPGKLCPAINKECPYIAEERQKQVDSLNTELEKIINLDKVQKIAWESFERQLKELGEDRVFDREGYGALKTEEILLAPAELELAMYKNLPSDIQKIEEECKNLFDEAECLGREISRMAAEMIDLQAKKNVDVERMFASATQEYEEILSSRQFKEGQLKAAFAIKEQVNSAQTDLAVIESKTALCTQDIESLEYIKEALGNKGVKSIVVDCVIPQLEKSINEVLSKLSDFYVTLETQREGVSGDTLLEGLFITITNGQGESFDLASYSGGEKMKITSAISEGLASLQKIGFRIFDESVTGLDSSTVESFTEVLMQIQNRFPQVICISHLLPIKDLFDHKIMITKQNGNSLIK